MNIGSTTLRLAQIAHELWCDMRTRNGWRHGSRYDPSGRTHDALVPFRALKPADRRCAILQVYYGDAESNLASLISYDRTDNPPLEIEEMRPGLPVMLTLDTDVHPAEGRASVGPREIGRVESWTTDPSGEFLMLVRVRWPDGALTEHAPLEKDLERVRQ